MKKTIQSLAISAFVFAGFFCEFAVPAEAENLDKNSVPEQKSALENFAKNFSPAENLDLSGTKIAYKLPEGFSAKIAGTTYEQLVNFDGEIRQPISAKTTKLTIEIFDNAGNSALTKTFEVAVPVKISGEKFLSENQKPAVVPAIQEWRGAAEKKFFVPAEDFFIRVPENFENSDEIFRERVALFAAELSEIFGRKIEVRERQNSAENLCGNAIEFVLEPENSELKFLGNEGYEIESAENSLKISSANSLGLFWATRTILQVFKIHGNAFPCGKAVDYPQYSLRGFMYDVGRKPASLEAVKNVLKTMSYYKLNDFQLHLNDNFIWLHQYSETPNGKNATPEEKARACQEVLAAAPTAFRLESKVVGENGIALTAEDHFYTKKEFGELLDLAKIYGVTIVPEFDVPGHAMSFVRVRPELMYRGTLTKNNDVERTAMLDASSDVFDPATGKTYREETLEFVQSVFDEFLLGNDGEKPVFRDAPFHIGTDEYYGSAEDYRAFTDAMLKYVKSRGRTPRLWGSFSHKKGKTPVVSEGVQIDIWAHGWQNPREALELGYDVINILDENVYVVPNGKGDVGAYKDLVNLPKLYSQNWHPNTFGPTTLVAGTPKLLGASWAIWNDNSFRGDFGLVDFDLFDRIHKTSAVLAEKTWNSGEDLSFENFMKLVDDVEFPPLTNPDFSVKSRGNVLFEMDFSDEKFADISGNGNAAAGTQNVEFSKNENGGNAVKFCGGESFVKTPILGIAPDFVAEIRVKKSAGTPAGTPQILFSSPIAKIFAVQKDSGKIGISREGWDFSFDYELEEEHWTTLRFETKGRETTLFVDGEKVGSPFRHKFPATHRYSTLVFPLEFIGAPADSFIGEIDFVKISKPSPAAEN